MIALSSGRLITATDVRRMWTPEKLNSGTDGSWVAGWPVLETSPSLKVAGMGGARAAFVM